MDAQEVMHMTDYSKITALYRNGGKRHVAYCSEYHREKPKTPNAIPRTSLTRICSCRPSRKC